MEQQKTDKRKKIEDKIRKVEEQLQLLKKKEAEIKQQEKMAWEAKKSKWYAELQQQLDPILQEKAGADYILSLQQSEVVQAVRNVSFMTQDNSSAE